MSKRPFSVVTEFVGLSKACQLDHIDICIISHFASEHDKTAAESPDIELVVCAMVQSALQSASNRIEPASALNYEFRNSDEQYAVDSLDIGWYYKAQTRSTASANIAEMPI